MSSSSTITPRSSSRRLQLHQKHGPMKPSSGSCTKPMLAYAKQPTKPSTRRTTPTTETTFHEYHCRFVASSTLHARHGVIVINHSPSDRRIPLHRKQQQKSLCSTTPLDRKITAQDASRSTETRTTDHPSTPHNSVLPPHRMHPESKHKHTAPWVPLCRQVAKQQRRNKPWRCSPATTQASPHLRF